MSKPRTLGILEPEGRGVPEKDESANIIDRENTQDSKAPKTSGAPKRGKEPLPNSTADRNTEGPREAGTTPRPTDKPIVGSER